MNHHTTTAVDMLERLNKTKPCDRVTVESIIEHAVQSAVLEHVNAENKVMRDMRGER